MKKRILLLSLLTVFCFTSLIARSYSGGIGTEADPYQIASIADLIELSNTTADWSNKYFIQTADILFNEDSSLVDWDGDGTVWDTDDEAGFRPIGNSSIKFSGSYNGQGNTIDHLFMDRRPSDDYNGLFGYIYDASISHLGLTNVNIYGDNYTGALLGRCTDQYTVIDSCYSTGKVLGNNYVGGLGGGIKGYDNVNYMLIENCFSTCEVEGSYQTGGFAGNLDDIYVKNCYSTGNVIGGNSYSGGFAGYTHRVDITNCFARGDVNAPEGDYVAGFAARLWVSNLENCYSTGHVTASPTATYVGGLTTNSAIGTVINSFWDMETSGQETSAEDEVGKTTEEMKADTTFINAGWDFVGESANSNEGIWNMDALINDGYPYLANLPDPEEPTPITLASFTAKASDGNVNISWSTASETNNAQFLIYKNNDVIATVDGAGTSSVPHNYSLVDDAVVPGVTYTYVLADLSYSNELVKHEDMAVTLTLDNDVIEADFTIGAAYPNPFNPSTVLPLELNSDATVTASLYDLNGREIKSLVNANFSAGTHELHIDGANMTTGIYMVKILVNNMLNVQKIAFVK